jgi:hypothetical protein
MPPKIHLRRSARSSDKMATPATAGGRGKKRKSVVVTDHAEEGGKERKEKKEKKAAATSTPARLVVTRAAWNAYNGTTWESMSTAMLMAVARHRDLVAGTRDMKKTELIEHIKDIDESPPSPTQLRRWILAQASTGDGEDDEDEDEDDTHPKHGDGDRTASAEAALLLELKQQHRSEAKTEKKSAKTAGDSKSHGGLSDADSALLEWAKADQQHAILKQIKKDKLASETAKSLSSSQPSAGCACVVPAASKFCPECGLRGSAALAGKPTPAAGDEKKEQAWESAPMAAHINKSTRDDIKRGTFVNLDKLLHPPLLAKHEKERVKVSDNIYYEKDSESTRRVVDFAAWTEAWIVYSAVLTSMRPERHTDLANYASYINQCTREFGFSVAQRYDVLLRTTRTGHTAKWEPVDVACMTRAHFLSIEPKWASTSNRSGAGGGGGGSGSSGGWQSRGGGGGAVSHPTRQAGETCKNWNFRKCTRDKACVYKHECLRCGNKEHGLPDCTKPPRASSPSRYK